MQAATPVMPDAEGMKQNRAFILGSLSIGHGLSHMFDQGFPLLVTEIAAAMGLGTFRTATVFAVRQAGSSATSLGGGPLIDHLKAYWGLILTGCMLVHAITFGAIGASPTFALLLVVVLFLSIPGSLWHLPSAAAISQRFPDRRGFAISMHGFGSNIGNVSGPVVAGALLATGLLWRHVFFIYAGLALLMALFVWWSLRSLGREVASEEGKSLSGQFGNALALLKNPIVMALIFAALLRGIGLNALFNWTPFYLRETLSLGTVYAGVYYALLTGMGIISAPVLGLLSDKWGRKEVLVPGFVIAALLSLVVVSAGGTWWLLAPILAGMGLFSFALHQIIQASVLDYVGQGSEATAIGLLFGINGVVGIGSPFLASAIINYFDGFYGSVFYYAGILTLVTAAIVVMIPLRNPNIGPGSERHQGQP